MNPRKLFIAFLAAAVAGALATLPASAELRTLTVTLADGQQITVTVDVAPGTPLEQITLPDLGAPVVGVADGGSPTPTPSPTPPAPTPTPPANVGGGGDGGGGDGGDGGGGEEPGGGAPEAPTAPSVDNTRGGGTPQKTVTRTEPASPKKKQKKKRNRSGGGGGGTGIDPAVQREIRRNRNRPVDRSNPGRYTDGTPTLNNPNYAVASPGAAAIGVPNFFIEKFRIPPFLLPIYQAAGMEYGIRWEILAAINEIETDYGRNLNVSYAGAVGWMQFMPPTWKAYGTDANGDGVKDPYNPVDAIFSAARYLKAAGAEKDLRKAIFAYNRADWYVDSVLMRARLIGGLPSNFVGSLTGLTQARFPVLGRSTYADDISERKTVRRGRNQNAAYLVQSDETRRGIRIYARRGAPVIAVNDGKIVKVGRDDRLGNFIQLQDAYGNTFTYGNLGKVNRTFAAPKPRDVTAAQIARELKLPRPDAKPTMAASTTAKRSTRNRSARNRPVVNRPAKPRRAPKRSSRRSQTRPVVETLKERLFANPTRPRARAAGGEQQLISTRPGRTATRDRDRDGEYTDFSSYLQRMFGLKRSEVQFKRLEVGARVPAGTILGRVGKTSPRLASNLVFEIRPAGRGAPRIDPKPILDGWKLLESTAIYRAAGKNPFFGNSAKAPSIGQILLMDKHMLTQRVLANPRIEIYDCGRRDVRTGQIDRRVLASLEFLAASGFKPTVTSLKCGRSGIYTKSGGVSHHVSGNAVDIAKVNGMSVLGNQGKGSITEMAVQRLLTLQGVMKPDQIITLMTFEGADNTYAMSDHHDHIHIGWRPLYGTNKKAARQVDTMLQPEQWIKLIDRLGKLDNPEVALKPSKFALRHTKRASRAHRGE